MSDVMFLVLLILTVNAAATKILLKSGNDGLLPHNHHSYHQFAKASSPILRGLFFNT